MTGAPTGERGTGSGAANRPTCDALVMFGATGDLARQKLFAALYDLRAAGRGFAPVLGVGRSDWSDADLRRAAEQSIRDGRDDVDDPTRREFLADLSYVRGATDDADTSRRIVDRLQACSRPLVYLGLPPSLFAETVAGLSAAGITDEARYLVEKPFGLDLDGAVQLSEALAEHVGEDQVFRIDHFLGKESLQDIVVFRFANRLIEPAWNREHVESVRIVMSEDSDAAERGSFYDGVGALRDVLQNHLLQLLTAVAMEPPDGDDDEALRRARTDLLRAVRPLRADDVDVGQYEGYRDTDGVADDSTTETFVRARLWIDDERWRDVPWTIETGKALGRSETVVDVRFRPLGSPTAVAREADGTPPAGNRVVIEVKPEPSIRLVLQARSDDLELSSTPTSAELDTVTGPASFDAYARLFAAARSGDRSVFASRSEVEAAWAVVDPVLDAGLEPVRYAPGSDVSDVARR
jgi:glucose-6-phosphate 1-dehydrogenase